MDDTLLNGWCPDCMKAFANCRCEEDQKPQLPEGRLYFLWCEDEIDHGDIYFLEEAPKKYGEFYMITDPRISAGYKMLYGNCRLLTPEEIDELKRRIDNE